MSRPLAQYAVRTPSKKHKEGYYHAMVFTSRTDLTMIGVAEHYDGRAGMEADRKRDKHGLGLAVIRKHLLPAQKMVVLLVWYVSAYDGNIPEHAMCARASYPCFHNCEAWSF